MGRRRVRVEGGCGLREGVGRGREWVEGGYRVWVEGGCG